MAKKQKTNFGLPSNKDGSLNMRHSVNKNIQLNKDGSIDKRSSFNRALIDAWNTGPKISSANSGKKSHSGYSAFSKAFKRITDKRPELKGKYQYGKLKKNFYRQLKGKKTTIKDFENAITRKFGTLNRFRKETIRKKKNRFKINGEWVSEATIGYAVMCCIELTEQGYKCDYKYIINLWHKLVMQKIDSDKYIHELEIESFREKTLLLKSKTSLNREIKLIENVMGYDADLLELSAKDKLISDYLSFDEEYFNSVQKEPRKRFDKLVEDWGIVNVWIRKFDQKNAVRMHHSIASEIMDQQLSLFWSALMECDPEGKYGFDIYIMWEFVTQTLMVDFDSYFTSGATHSRYTAELRKLKDDYDINPK